MYSFDAEETHTTSEIALLASLAEVSVVSFLRNVSELQKRGLVQQRGKWKAVLPHAIANRLAARALEAFPRGMLSSTFVEGGSDRVARSFSRRIGYLHDSVSARALVREFLRPGGRFSDPAALNDIGRQIFRNIAPVDPASALAALKATAQEREKINLDSAVRSDLIRVARSIAYDSSLFDDAFGVLLALALSEADGGNNQSASDPLKSLFYCHLSGTHATTGQRVGQVRSLLTCSDERKVELGLRSLEAALETTHFSSHFDFQFGARKRDYGWMPQTWEDVRSWYTPFVEIAVQLGAGNGELARELRYVLGRAFRGLWKNAQLSDKLEWAAQELSQGEGWSEGWVGARETLHWEKAKLPTENLRKLEYVEQLLAPKDLTSEIRSKVLARGAFAIDLVDEGDEVEDDPVSRFNRSRLEAEALGRLAASDGDLIEVLLPEFLKGKSVDKIYSFGVGLGAELEEAGRLFDGARQIVSNSAPSDLSLILLRGVMSGWETRDPDAVATFLDQAVDDGVWGKRFPELQVAAGIGDGGFQRIVKAIERDLGPTWQYRYLSGGRATDLLNIEQIGELIERISSLSEGLAVAVDLLGMVVFSVRERGEDSQFALAEFCGRFLANLDWYQLQSNDTMIDYHTESILTFYLMFSRDQTADARVLDNVLAWERSPPRSWAFRRGRFLKPFLSLRTKSALDAIYHPDDDGEYSTARQLVANRDNDRGERPMSSAPIEEVLDWCSVSPKDRYLFVAETCLLYSPEKQNSDDHQSRAHVSEIARVVFSNAPNKRAVLGAYINRLMPMSWSGSRAAMLKKRLAIIDDLDADDDADLFNHIAREKERFLTVVSAIEAQEQEEERGRSASFE